MPGSETFSPFINSDIRFPCFSAGVLWESALIALHVMAEEGRDWDGFQVPGWGMNGKWAAQRVRCGKVKAKLGRRMKMRLLPPLVKALCAMMRCASSWLHGPGDKIFLFLQDWELAKVAPSCHMALDMLCEESA